MLKLVGAPAAGIFRKYIVSTGIPRRNARLSFSPGFTPITRFLNMPIFGNCKTSRHQNDRIASNSLDVWAGLSRLR